jgi:hypothetical protein
MTVHKRGSTEWLSVKNKARHRNHQVPFWIFKDIWWWICTIVKNFSESYFISFHSSAFTSTPDQPTWLHVYIMEKYLHITNQANCVPSLPWGVWR